MLSVNRSIDHSPITKDYFSVSEGEVCRCYGDASFSLLASLYLPFRPSYGFGVDSATNRSENHEYFLGVKAADA